MIEEEIDFNNSVEAVMEWVRRNSNWAETLLIVTGDHECGYLCGPGSAATQSMQPVINNGAGQVPGMEWNSGDHTNSLIPLYAKGWASLLFHCYANECDGVRGRYIDNTEIAKLISGLLR
jgi:alkaline phosphatase